MSATELLSGDGDGRVSQADVRTSWKHHAKTLTNGEKT